MPLRSKIIALLLVAASGVAMPLQAQNLPAPPEDLPKGDGPRGTSQAVPGQERYDEVGYALVAPEEGAGAIFATHKRLAAGSFVEVTSLETGRTVAMMVSGAEPSAPDGLIGLTPAAARALGVDGGQPVAVRVRTIEPSQQEQTELHAGRLGSERLDAPKLLLTALRKRLPPIVPAVVSSTPAQTRAPARPFLAPPGASYPAPGNHGHPLPTAPKTAPARIPPRPAAQVPTPVPPKTATGRYFVQVAALSNADRARALAGSLNGIVVPGGGLYRVRIGPYRDTRSAQLARDGVARRGYADARVVTNP